MSALRRRERQREGNSFVNATPNHVKYPPPSQNLPPAPLCALLTHPPLALLCFFLLPNVGLDEKQNTFICKKKKRGQGREVRLVVWLMCEAWFLDRYILLRSFWIQLVRQRGKAGSRLAGIYFPSSPHFWLNRGSPLKCLWPLEERGRGLIGLFCQIGHRHSEGPFTGCSRCVWGRGLWCPRC